MPLCIICHEMYYPATELDPAEYCICGEGANGTLWQWNRFAAYRKWFRYFVARILYKIANWLVYNGTTSQ